MEDIRSEYVVQSQSNLFVTKEAAIISGSRTVPNNSILASCVGEFGIASLCKTEVIINQQIQAYIPKSIEPAYLYYIVVASKCYFESVATITTIAYVNQEKFGELPIPLPSRAEQKDITKYIDHRKTNIQTVISQTQREIELIQEYRITLISDAVTGKIDLRD
jgi:type I restriction enzyme, S subunit